MRASPHVVSYNLEVSLGGSRFGINSGDLYIQLKPRGQRPPIGAVIQELRRQTGAITGLSVFLNPAQNLQIGARPSKSLYQYTLQAGNLDELFRFAPLVDAEIRKLPALQDISSDLQIKSPQAVLNIDRQKAAALGLTSEQIRATLYNSFGSRQVATIYAASNDYAVILEHDPIFQQNPNDLSKVFVRSSAGQLVPLSTVATMTQVAGPLTINHQGQLPAVTVSFNLAPGVALGEAIDRIQDMERRLVFPPTITAGFSGTAQVFQQSLRGQGWLLLATVVVIYIVLGILYESFIHPITILSGLPAAGIGALLTLMLFKMELSVIAIIGVIMLVGIVKKNAIMMIDFAIDAQRNRGEPPERAIHQACLLRFRPIMMTTMAAIMGTLPIALGLGAGAELRQPLGVAVVGGLLTSQLLTLLHHAGHLSFARRCSPRCLRSLWPRRVVAPTTGPTRRIASGAVVVVVRAIARTAVRASQSRSYGTGRFVAGLGAHPCDEVAPDHPRRRHCMTDSIFSRRLAAVLPARALS